MSKISELRTKRNQLWEQTKAFLEDHRDANGLVEASAVEQYNKMVNDVKAMGEQITLLENQAEMDNLLNQPTSTPIVNQPTSGMEKMTDKAVQNKAFWDYIRFGTPIRNSVTPMAEGAGATGGYTVPDEFERTLIQKLKEQNVIRQIAHVIRTNSGQTEIPVAGGDISAAWTSEAASIAETTETFKQVTLNAYKLAARLKISNELLYDSAFDLASYIASEFGTAFGAKEEQAFCVGLGGSANQPTGIFTIASGDVAERVGAYLGTRTIDSTVVPNGVTFDALFALYYSLKAPYRQNASWLTSEEVMLQLMTLKDSTGAYLWKPSFDVAKPDTFLGRPIYTSAYVPTPTAAAGSGASQDILAFGDFGKYWIADRGNRSFKRLNELYAETDQTGFVATQRVDAKVVLPEAIKVLRMGDAPQG